jgi:hypothetical protein
MGRSPVLVVLLKLLRIGVVFCAASVLFFFLIEVWKNWGSGATHIISLPDYVFLAVLVAVFAGALALVRAIAREIRKMETIDRGSGR